MFTKQVTAPAHLKTAGADEGSIEAVFATFDAIDLDGDVTLPGAFTTGQEVIMCWSHDWGSPIGKGAIRVEPTRALFAGRFWLDTAAGLEAYRRVKNAGDLQEFSYGYSVIDGEYGTYQGRDVRFLKTLSVSEVSPVLKGAAGPGNSYTLSVKQRQGPGHAVHPAIVTALRDEARRNGVALPPSPRERLELERIRAGALGVWG